MKVSLFGLGYVGCVSAACLSRSGNRVIGVDVNPLKTEILNSGQSPIVEKDVQGLIMKAVSSGYLRATLDSQEAVLGSDLSLICVGTPSLSNGGLDLRHVFQVGQEIGKALRQKPDSHVVVLRSTVVPGTAQRLAEVLEEHSGKKPGQGFDVVVNPEFLREGSAVADFTSPPFTLLGGESTKALDLVAELYRDVEAPLLRVETRVAEMVKYANNAFHAAKIVFANEIGNLCKAMGVDSHRVMDIFCMDRKLNLSASYLKPGFAFGGSCLPKDLRALTARARQLDVPTPLLDSILPSNSLQVRRVIDQLLAWKIRNLGFLGLSFKGGTDDLRESPIVEVIETLLGKGYAIKIYDPNVSLAKIFGANKDYIEKEIPHLDRLMCEDPTLVTDHADVIVIANHSKEFKNVLAKLGPEKRVLDLVRLSQDPLGKSEYHGISW